ncbi:MAG: excinuclease ABC subunit UvrA [Candidatus Roizmanbacteria bacterium]
MLNKIIIKGAKEHNLQNVNVEIPKNEFVVITGVSGSGKSSLAFDTIYAEGQRRYVESLSAYARQFLGVMDKPDVEYIEGLSPSISIDQKTVSHNPRSTVGTITEIYDYLRLLFARIGHPHCPKDGTEITKLTTDEITTRILDVMRTEVNSDKIKPHKFIILSPVVRQRKGEFRDLFTNLLSKGFSKVFVDGSESDLNDDIPLIKTNKHTIEAVIDTYSFTTKDYNSDVFQANLRSRLSNTIEQSTSLSSGLVLLRTESKDFLFSENFTCPMCGFSLSELEPRMFSFNSPIGACDKCKGLGTIFRVDPDSIFNPKLSIHEGGILPFNKFFFAETWYTRLLKKMANEEGIDMNLAIGKLSAEHIQILLKGTGSEKVYTVQGTNRMGRPTVIVEKFEGLVKELERRYYESTGNDSAGMEIQKYMREEMCTTCEGAKLKPEILSITIDEINIAKITEKAVTHLITYYQNELLKKLNTYESIVSKPILKEIITRLTFLHNVGLGYLTISRAARTLSGGELQRIRLASQIGTGLTGVLYVLDEPSIGLHPKDVSALIRALHNLKDLGNTLIVVEHDQETIESANYIVELGPMAGKNGGKLTFTGTVKEMLKSKNSLTGQYMSGRKKIEVKPRDLETKRGKVVLRGAKQFNLKDVTAELPLGNLIAITGVSGSGKSTMVVETLYPAMKYHLDGYYHDSMGDFARLEGFHYLDRVYLVDQGPIGRTPRSNPATYIGFFDEIREIFASTTDAKARGFQKGRFSFNLKGGRCEKCQGAGVIKIEMQFLADVYVVCDVCEGHRYNKETLEVRYKGINIYDILKMTVDEAISFFANHQNIHTKLLFMQQVGLGYVELGQPAPTFSGGEAQRMKLVNELSRRDSGKTMYILDEPTTGLHFYDIQKLLSALYQLIERGNTVVVIEHNLDIIKHAQYIIDMGPEGGDNGGKIIFQGPTKEILSIPESFTGQYLKRFME